MSGLCGGDFKSDGTPEMDERRAAASCQGRDSLSERSVDICPVFGEESPLQWSIQRAADSHGRLGAAVPTLAQRRCAAAAACLRPQRNLTTDRNRTHRRLQGVAAGAGLAAVLCKGAISGVGAAVAAAGVCDATGITAGAAAGDGAAAAAAGVGDTGGIAAGTAAGTGTDTVAAGAGVAFAGTGLAAGALAVAAGTVAAGATGAGATGTGTASDGAAGVAGIAAAGDGAGTDTAGTTGGNASADAVAPGAAGFVSAGSDGTALSIRRFCVACRAASDCGALAIRFS